jgi:Domain of unknown function (DUF4440)
MQAKVKAFVLLCIAASLSWPAGIRAQQTSRASADGDTPMQDSLLVSRERALWDALKARDTTSFGRLMGGNVVDIDASGVRRTSPATTARYVLGCQTTSYVLSEPRVVRSATTATITYTATVEATCWGQKAPSPLYVMTVYEHEADAWVPVAHSETPAAHW